MGNYKLLFIVFHGLNKLGGGIGKKIRAQVHAFESLGVQTSLSYLEVNKNGHYIGRKVNENLIEDFQPVLGKQYSWVWRVKFGNLQSYIEQHQINIVYIRYTHFANPFFNSFLRELKKMGVKILLEIPTYPYDAESRYDKFSVKLIKWFERRHRRSFYKYIDRIVTFSKEKKIFDVPTVNIHNGVNLSWIKINKSVSGTSDIHLIAVAVINVWHGYDRLIEGMKYYYQTNPNRTVYLHIVGDNDNKGSLRYKALVQEYGLEKYVVFHGFCSGETLDKLYDQADLAIGPLGFHRVNVHYVTPIKLAEYSARGIPFIYSGTNYLFDNQSFVLKLPEDESRIHVTELLRFLDQNSFNSQEIRTFAEQYLTWEKQMKKVLEEVLV